MKARSWEPEGLAVRQPGLPDHLPHLLGRDNCTHPSLQGLRDLIPDVCKGPGEPWVGGVRLCPGLCHPFGQSQASAPQSCVTSPRRGEAEVGGALRPRVAVGSSWCPRVGDSSSPRGAAAACSPQASVPWHRGASDLMLPWGQDGGDARHWLCPSANAQQGLAHPSQGCTH